MNPNIAQIAAILADHSCSQMILLLMDGKFHTVTELAKIARIQNHTASYHLKKLLALGWIQMEKHGRFHYYRLCNSEVAEVIETLMPVSEISPVRSFSQHSEKELLFYGRTCYDHMAGKLGVGLTKWLVEKEYLDASQTETMLTNQGEAFLRELGVDLVGLKQQKRQFCRMCLDWSEREHHVAGGVGNALYQYFSNNQWVVPHGNSRGLQLTEKGKLELSSRWNAKDLVVSLSEK